MLPPASWLGPSHEASGPSCEYACACFTLGEEGVCWIVREEGDGFYTIAFLIPILKTSIVFFMSSLLCAEDIKPTS